MTYGALAIYEDQPELARRVINRAIESVALPMADYGPDGAYPEVEVWNQFRRDAHRRHRETQLERTSA